MASPVELTLSDDDVGDLVLTDEPGFCYVDMDLGYPVVRDSVQPRVSANGSDDSTALFGPRAVTLTLAVQAGGGYTKQQNIDRLAPYMLPSRRPALVFVLEDGGDERRVLLRAAQYTAPFVAPFWRQVQRVSCGWAAPHGVIESSEIEEDTVIASGDDEGGIVFALDFPFSFGDAAPVGTINVTNRGTAPTPPVLRLYGPCDDPRIENVTVDKRMEFVGLTLAAGEYVELDMRERTVYLSGDDTQSRYSYVDFVESDWWDLAPGVNELRYYPASFSDGAQAVIIFRSAWLT